MRLLAFDTVGDGCSAGISDDAETLALAKMTGAGGHAEQLPLMIEEVLAEAGLALEALDALAVTVGPGSFSGIRTCLAMARGLALVTGLRAFPVTTLEALAHLAAEEKRAELDGLPIGVVIDARRGEVVAQTFTNAAEAAGPAEVTTPQAAAAMFDGPTVLIGSGVKLLPERPRPRDLVLETGMDARAVALAALAMTGRGTSPVLGTALSPFYTRAADARADAGRSLLQA